MVDVGCFLSARVIQTYFFVLPDKAMPETFAILKEGRIIPLLMHLKIENFVMLARYHWNLNFAAVHKSTRIYGISVCLVLSIFLGPDPF